jgi:superfamily II DNA or RNA helicase
MTEIILRDYQREAIDAVFKAWADGMQRPAIVLPTGAGKTVVFSALIREFIPWADDDTATGIPVNQGKRVIVLAHRDELVDQAIAKLKAVMPGVNVGKVKAGDDDITADVMVCSVQTLASARRRDRLRSAQHWPETGPVGLIITDECHHAAAASYKKIYEAFPDALQLGVTATMARGDKVGLGSTWDAVVYKRSILWMISKGYLTDVVTTRIDLKELDMGAVKASRGDWQAGDLGRALMDAQADTAIARAYREHAGDRQGIVFTPTVETAHAAADALGRGGIRTRVVSGETPVVDRREWYEQFRAGSVQVLVNCMVLTEGFDMPQAEVAVIARPTQSAPLYTQMVGRVLRPWPGKERALVLDLVGASSNKLRTLIDLEEGAVREIRPGESLAEAAEREAEEEQESKIARVAKAFLDFEMRSKQVSAFGASEDVWLRTPGGVSFIPCGPDYVFLWPSGEAGTWDVCTRSRDGKWERTGHTGLPLAEAMAWGEAVSEDFGSSPASRSARWRQARPTLKQVRFAAARGIDVKGKSQGQLAEALDIRFASRVFDEYVRG